MRTHTLPSAYLRLSLLLTVLLWALTASASPTLADSASPRRNQPQPKAVHMTAADMVGKVYGVVDPGRNYDEAMSMARERLRIMPSADPYGVWVENRDGYIIDYYGMSPETTAMARFDGEGVLEDFGYFFFFPYECGDRESANGCQCEFCRVLLQELHDIGAELDQAQAPDTLFNVVGRYDDKFVELQLVEQLTDWQTGDGIFVLSVRVSPGAFTAADDLAAL